MNKLTVDSHRLFVQTYSEADQLIFSFTLAVEVSCPPCLLSTQTVSSNQLPILDQPLTQQPPVYSKQYILSNRDWYSKVSRHVRAYVPRRDKTENYNILEDISRGFISTLPHSSCIPKAKNMDIAVMNSMQCTICRSEISKTAKFCEFMNSFESIFTFFFFRV